MTTSTATVNSILARCLMDPTYLSQIRRDPATRFASVDVDDRTRSELIGMDWNRVWAFAGFITKVQHNDLWPVLPYTRAALKSYRFEIELFARYRPTFLALRARRPSREQKVTSFLRFLDETVSAADYPGLPDLAHHEAARWLAEGAAKVDEPDPGPGDLLVECEPANANKLRPYLRGHLGIAEFERDPEVLIRAINEGSFGRPSAPGSPRWLGYWAQPLAHRVRLLELDALSCRILVQVNGARSLETIARLLRAPRRLVRAVLEAGQAQGLIGTRLDRRIGGRHAAATR